MLCTEAKELLRIGYSRRLLDFGRAYGPVLARVAEHSAICEEVDEHVNGCRSCQRALVSENWRRWLRRPGPLSLLRVLLLSRQLRRMQPFEPRPLGRIVNIMFKQAIESGIRELLVETVLIRAAADHAPAGDEAAPSLCVRGRAQEAQPWTEILTMPPYMAPAITARLKSMANLLIGRSDLRQQGSLSLRFRGRNYDVQMTAMPVPHSETLLLHIEAA